MFRAIGNWFRSLGHFITGRVDSSARDLDTDPHAMRSQYDGIIREKQQRLQQYKDAVASLIAQQETKLGTLKQLSEEAGRLEELKAGALAKAKSVVAKLQEQGLPKEAVHQDDDYQKCLTGFNDFSSTLKEKQARIDELENDVASYSQRIEEHKLQLKDLLKEVDKLRSERADAVADVISAKQERELNDTLAGIGEDTAGAKLQELRQLRQEVKAGARVSRELSGSEEKVQEAEFLEYAKQSAGAAEFDQLIGLAGEADAAPPSPAAGAAEPERRTDGPSGLPE